MDLYLNAKCEPTLNLPSAARFFAALLSLACTFNASIAYAQTWKPERPVELVVFAAAGGGNDKAARVIQKIWHDNRLLEAVVVNKVGGGGSLAYTYVSQKADGHSIGIAQAAGADPKKLKILVFGGGAESVTNLLGGHIDAMAQAANNAAPHYQAGKMRILGLSTEKRSASLPDVPTFREQGYNVTIDGWYVFVGPKNMTPAQIAYWDGVFAKTVQTAEWKKFAETTGWELGYKNSQETAAYLRKENDEAKAILTELGLAKQ